MRFRTIPRRGWHGRTCLPVAAARLGAQVTLIGRVGDDPFGPALIENLRRENINTDFITLDDEATTGAAFITVMPDGQNAIISVLGANKQWSDLPSQPLLGKWPELPRCCRVLVPQRALGC